MLDLDSKHCKICKNKVEMDEGEQRPQGADPLPLPLPLRVAMSGRNHLNEEITPLLPTGIGKRCSQTISNLGHAEDMQRSGADVNSPYKQKC